jgi:hypothetical protein
MWGPSSIFWLPLLYVVCVCTHINTHTQQVVVGKSFHLILECVLDTVSGSAGISREASNINGRKLCVCSNRIWNTALYRRAAGHPTLMPAGDSMRKKGEKNKTHMHACIVPSFKTLLTNTHTFFWRASKRRRVFVLEGCPSIYDSRAVIIFTGRDHAPRASILSCFVLVLWKHNRYRLIDDDGVDLPLLSGFLSIHFLNNLLFRRMRNRWWDIFVAKCRHWELYLMSMKDDDIYKVVRWEWISERERETLHSWSCFTTQQRIFDDLAVPTSHPPKNQGRVTEWSRAAEKSRPIYTHSSAAPLTL